MSYSLSKEKDMLQDCVDLLSRLISIPSFSREENETADVWEEWLKMKGASPLRFHNNVYAFTKAYDPKKPILMLNSHHDTVRPVASYSRDPFSPALEGEKLYGLGSNDAGASGVALAATFLQLMDSPDLNMNLLLTITAAEEVMGEYGMRAFLPYLRDCGLYPAMAIVGEPTEMQPAVAERGLVVLDGFTPGVAGHAARNEGENAIYRSIADINTLRNFQPEKVSDTLGPLKINVTMISAGTQHNIIPDKCTFVVDVRTTDAYTNVETVELLQKEMKWSTLTPRSTRIQASVIPSDHVLVRAASELGLVPFVSPTTSDMSLMHDIPSLKIGPGKSARSHTADEYILISEIEQALKIYPQLIKLL